MKAYYKLVPTVLITYEHNTKKIFRIKNKQDQCQNYTNKNKVEFNNERQLTKYKYH